MKAQLNVCRHMVFAMLALVLMNGCQELNTPHIPFHPIHFVTIDDGVSDTNLRTKTGEEVRWVNVRTAPVAVIFPGLMDGDLSCNRGFSQGEDRRITAVIFPDSQASLCFSKPGQLTYRVVDVQRSDVELNHAATIQVVTAGR